MAPDCNYEHTEQGQRKRASLGLNDGYQRRVLRPRLVAFLLSAIVVVPALASAAVFTVVNTNSTGPGSFAQAVEDANTVTESSEEACTIAFAIPGAGVHKIDLSETNVVLLRRTAVDGYSQPGASPNTLAVGSNAVILIQLDGGRPGATGTGGLAVVDSACTVRGLSFTGFRTAITIGNLTLSGHGGNRLEGNFIGLAPDGVTIAGNNTGMFFLNSLGDVVGGKVPAARNVFAGNGTGVSECLGTIIGNYFGTDASGLRQGYGNRTAISRAYVVGTAEPGAGNVITGNTVGIDSAEKIQGNVIGPRADGGASFGNGTAIAMTRSDALVGGLGAGEGNVIAFNGTGVRVPARTGSPHVRNRILSNVFHSNSRDIDLGSDGPTQNDFRDGDNGPNKLQNFPVISSVARLNGETTVRGGVNSAPNTSFLLQFVANGPDTNRGQKFLGTQTVTTNSAGDARFEFRFATTVAEEDFVTATATDPDGNTSEFFPRDGAVQLGNISARANVGTGEQILIGGFIASTGQGPRMLIRSVGPSLRLNGALADPELEVRYGDGSLGAINRNWREHDEQAIRATGLAPSDDREAALIFTPVDRFGLEPRADRATVLVRGENGSTGIATVEIYSLEELSAGATGRAKFRNISTRGQVGTGDNVLIGGAIITGSAPQRVIVRAIGPDLAEAGIATPLQDPTLELRDAEGNLLMANDNWRSDQAEEISATGLAPKHDRDAAIVATLLPSAYTAIVRGKDETTGIGLVEIYTVP
ncbi:MAG TPA: hypothetical protein VF551_00050 [Chthoniobacterales bacterium]